MSTEQRKGKKKASKEGKRKKNWDGKLPKKTWKKEKADPSVRVNPDPPSDSPAELLKAAGGNGTNIDSQAVADPPAGGADTVTGLTSKLYQKLAIDGTSLSYAALGIVLRALKSGWVLRPGAQDDPYMAWRFLYDTFVSAASGTIDTVTTAPIWFWEFLYAIRPKEASFKTGRIEYAITVSDPETPLSQTFRIGDNLTNIVVFFGYPTSTTKNGFCQLNASPTYDVQLGAAAVANMWSNFTNTPLGELIVDPGEDAVVLKEDTSAFAACYPELGMSYNAPGGLATTLQSERFIAAPVLAKFCVYQEDLDNVFWRGFHEYRHSAGGASYVLPRMSEFKMMRQVYNKVSPVFKFYNLDEYFTQLASCFTTAVENLLEDETQHYTSYPLTIQQFTIMLRQVLLAQFNNEMALDLKIDYVGSQSSGTFLPFSVGTNGFSLVGLSQPLFPQFFVEGVRAAKRILADIKGPKGQVTGTIDIIPILGLWRPLGGQDYPGRTQWTYNTTDGPMNFFLELEEEDAFDLLSCSYDDGTTTTYYDFNGKELSDIITAHNLWISGMSNVLTGLSTIGSEKGINALHVSNITAYCEWVENVITGSSTVNPPEKLAPIKDRKTEFVATVTKETVKVGNKAPVTTKLERRLSKGPKKTGFIRKETIKSAPVGTSYLTFQGITHYTSNMPLYAAPWKYKSLIVSPVWWPYNETYDGSIAEWQTMQMEPFSLPISNVNSAFTIQPLSPASYVTIFDKNVRAGILDTKAIKSDAMTEMERDMNALGAAGRGGFFTEIAAGLAKTIGEITGW